MVYSPDSEHEALLQKKPLLAFDSKKSFESQKNAIHDKFIELLGISPEKPDKDEFTILSESIKDNIKETVFTFKSEARITVECVLWVPNTGLDSYPVIVTLQGHSTGKHISMGKTVYPNDSQYFTNDHAYGKQAIEHNWASLMLDLRGMGERRTVNEETERKPDDFGKPRCHIPSMTALLLGRTMIRERVWDVSRAIDMLDHFPIIDKNRIACMGISGGGTATFYSACLDERIKLAVPSCSVCTYKDSIGTIRHCVCNFIPGIARYMDMGDLTALIAPRKLIVVAGKQDIIFPEHGVKEAFETIKKVYAAAGVPDNCELVFGDGGHRFFAKETWPAFEQMAKNI